jgi:hypothetical protein
MGRKMDYHVAIDRVPAGKDGHSGAMATTWHDAVDQHSGIPSASGIPTAFIVSKDARIAWIGYPMKLGDVLTKLVAGKFDVNVAAADCIHKQKLQARLGACLRINSPGASIRGFAVAAMFRSL